MKIKYKGKQVEVQHEDCPYRKCFAPHHYQHRSYNGTEGSITNTNKYLSCATNDYHGCPEEMPDNKEYEYTQVRVKISPCSESTIPNRG